MEKCTILSQLLDLFEEHAEGIKIALIILGWMAIPLINHWLTKKRERTSLINKNIENIESLFQYMNGLASEQFKLESQDNSIYYKLIQCNQKLGLYCNRLSEIDAKFSVEDKTIANIRKYTTNDKFIEKHGEHTMHFLVHEQMDLIKSYPQQY